MSATAAPGAPLRFRNPPGWPNPTPAWVAQHQGWQPPPRWTPVAGAPRAPHNWVFWEHNASAWTSETRRFTAAARRAAVTGWALTAVGLAIVVAALWLAVPPVTLGFGVGSALAVVGLVLAVAGHARLAQANKRAYLAVVLSARHGARASRPYEQYVA